MTEMPTVDLLRGYPVVITTPVAWGDMDFFRHVNNTVFFRFFESARIAYLARIGFEEELAESGIGPILAATHARFRQPLTYPDIVHLGARTTEIRADRFIMEYCVYSEKLASVAADGGGVVVSFDYRGKHKASLPAAIRLAIEEVESGRGG